jgi:hypothetical protein
MFHSLGRDIEKAGDATLRDGKLDARVAQDEVVGVVRKYWARHEYPTFREPVISLT